MKISAIFLYILLAVQFSFSQEATFSTQEISINKFIDGTLLTPPNIEAPDLVIFIQGSGPTDRNGNQMMMKNDGVKLIAEKLAEEGIASFRFDKRIFKMNRLRIKEEDLRFEHFVDDVIAIQNYFKDRNQFNRIILAGHSEGSLIGMLAANNGADAFISLAGAGRSIDKIIVEQLAKQSELLSENAKQALEEIKVKGRTTNYNPLLESLFRASVQPYMRSWMKYEPASEITKLNIPILLVNGTKDLQVDVTDAQLLKEAKPEAQLVIIESMNHIFREIKGEDLDNSKSYNEAYRPLHPEIIDVLINFIKSTREDE